MVERYRRGRNKASLLGNHQQCWLWGRNLVLETLRAERWPVLELYCSDELTSEEAKVVRALAKRHNCSVYVQTRSSIKNLCHSSEHQGYLAKMVEFPYMDPLLLLDQAMKDRKNPLFVICDGIQDPFNFGALIRSAEVFGVDGIFIGTSYQVVVTSRVARSSEGAVSHMAIARSEDIREIAYSMKDRGIQVLGTSSNAGDSIFQCQLTQPTTIVVGNEGTGIRDSLREACSQLIHIPQFGEVSSLNAAVSAGVLFYEACRQRSKNYENK